jgi:hypothetical protein
MFERGEWLRMWVVLTVIWTIVVATLGWINLPRARHIPHNPEYLNRLPNEAALILIGSESKVRPSRWGAPIWSDVSISVAMPNGARLAFPSTTTNQRIVFVRNEYRKLLEAEASAQRRAYALEMIMIWLLPCPILLVLCSAADVICRVCQSAARKEVAGSAAMQAVHNP